MNTQIMKAASLTELGLSAQPILDFMEQHQKLGLHALAVVRGHKVFTLSVKPYKDSFPHTLFSLSKSFCSMAAGIAVGEGLLSYDDKLTEVMKDELPETYDKALDQITLHHLLSMSSGLDERSDHEIRSSLDWVKAALSYPLKRKPGTTFHYNTMGTYLAGRMVSKRAGQTLRDYLQPRLFDKIGIAKPQWDCCPLGHNTGGFGLHLSVLDIARAGRLLLDDGLVNGERVLPEEYLKRATVKQIDNRNPEEKDPYPDWSQGYGYQYWMSRHGRYRGDGMYGQVMMVDQQNKLCLCVTAGTNLMGDELDAIHTAMNQLVKLPPDAAADKALAKKMNTYEIKAPADKGEAVTLEGTYLHKDGRTLRLETPDDKSLRVFLRYPDHDFTLAFTFCRGDKPHHGEFFSFAKGERPQGYEGRFGVSRGVVTAQAVMKEAPYQVNLKISPQKNGIKVTSDSIGPDSGTWHFEKVGA
ncbi:MAG: serine hydrolase [Clostridiales bacterium]|jgi:CubicO group peptidase (beta-lactamase class C family)|nr:serine hydrolase [Clostridiales bacterium]